MTRPRIDVIYLTILIVAVFTAALLTSSYAARRATSAAVTVTQLCETINATRARQVVLWEHLMAVEAVPRGESAAARAVRLRASAAFIAYIQRIFAPADCHHAAGFIR